MNRTAEEIAAAAAPLVVDEGMEYVAAKRRAAKPESATRMSKVKLYAAAGPKISVIGNAAKAPGVSMKYRTPPSGPPMSVVWYGSSPRRSCSATNQ